MSLKTTVFKNKKKHFLTPQFCSFIVYLLPSLVNYWTYMTLLLSREGVTKDWYHKSKCF